MWIQNVYGHFSVVCASDRSPANGKKMPAKVDTSTLMVRARLREHMENLIEAFPAILGAAEIVETPHNDYRFRILISRSQFTDLMSGLADVVDYGNFKSAVAAREGTSPYEKALHQVWGVMYRLQRDAYPEFQDPESQDLVPV